MTSPRVLLTFPQQQEFWSILSTGGCCTFVPQRVLQLLDSFRRQRPDNLHPIIVWVIENTGGFTPVALGETSETWEIEPEVSDAEYDRGTLAEISIQVAEKRQSSAATMGRVRRGASGFIGVDPDKRTGRWRARIRVGGKRIHLGYFGDARSAAAAYDQAALEHFGAVAVVNDQARKVAWLANNSEQDAQ